MTAKGSSRKTAGSSIEFNATSISQTAIPIAPKTPNTSANPGGNDAGPPTSEETLAIASAAATGCKVNGSATTAPARAIPRIVSRRLADDRPVRMRASALPKCSSVRRRNRLMYAIGAVKSSSAQTTQSAVYGAKARIAKARDRWAHSRRWMDQSIAPCGMPQKNSESAKGRATSHPGMPQTTSTARQTSSSKPISAPNIKTLRSLKRAKGTSAICRIGKERSACMLGLNRRRFRSSAA